MKLLGISTRSLQADMQAELRDIERAVAAGTRSAGQLRRQVGSARLDQRLANRLEVWIERRPRLLPIRHRRDAQRGSGSVSSRRASNTLRCSDNRGLARALDARDRIDDFRRGEIGDLQRSEAAVPRGEADRQERIEPHRQEEVG